MINAQDNSSQIQAAIKNAASNVVFYFVIPIDFDAVTINSSIDVNSFAASWKSLDETCEASAIIKGD